MASTYSPTLRIQLIATGEQANTWGATTNTNLGTLIEEAISGSSSVDVTAGNVVLTTLNGVTDQARKMVIIATGTPGVARTITAPAFSKTYTVHNNSNAVLNFIASGAAGVSFAVGAKKIVYFDGTNFAEAINALTTPALGTPTSGVLSSCSGLPISTGISGLGTGVATFLATPSSANLKTVVTDETGSGALVFGISPTIATPVITGDTSINSLTVGKGTGSVATNTVFGVNALDGTPLSNQNTAIGSNAGYAGASNVSIGADAGAVNAGNTNTIVGTLALKSCVDAANNTVIGYQSLRDIAAVCTNSIAIGSSTGGQITAVIQDSVLIGNDVFLAASNSINNVVIGHQARAIGASAPQNTTIIGYKAFNAGCGTSCVGVGANVTASSTGVTNEVSIYNGTVNARFQGSASSWTFVSDARDKTAIENLPLGLDFITQLQPRKFQWDLRSTDTDKGKEASGFIAQEVLAVLESNNAVYTGVVNTDDPNQYALAQPNLIPMLVNAIKELKAEIDLLKAKV